MKLRYLSIGECVCTSILLVPAVIALVLYAVGVRLYTVDAERLRIEEIHRCVVTLQLTLFNRVATTADLPGVKWDGRYSLPDDPIASDVWMQLKQLNCRMYYTGPAVIDTEHTVTESVLTVGCEDLQGTYVITTDASLYQLFTIGNADKYSKVSFSKDLVMFRSRDDAIWWNLKSMGDSMLPDSNGQAASRMSTQSCMEQHRCPFVRSGECYVVDEAALEPSLYRIVFDECGVVERVVKDIAGRVDKSN